MKPINCFGNICKQVIPQVILGREASRNVKGSDQLYTYIPEKAHNEWF